MDGATESYRVPLNRAPMDRAQMGRVHREQHQIAPDVMTVHSESELVWKVVMTSYNPN